MALFRRSAPPPPAEDDYDAEYEYEDEIPEPELPRDPKPEADTPTDDFPASRLRGTEPLYGVVVGLELLVVAILNLAVQGGAGAPKHPDTLIMVLGVAVSVGFIGLLALRNRTVASFGAIGAAFFVTLPKVPSSLSLAHIMALLVPLAYALIITSRQRKMAKGALQRGGRRAPRMSESRQSRATRSRNTTTARPAAKAAGRPTSGRYTPPKARRAPPKTRRGR
jgi:hypothetical protein